MVRGGKSARSPRPSAERRSHGGSMEDLSHGIIAVETEVMEKKHSERRGAREHDAQLSIKVLEVVNLPLAKGKKKGGVRFCSIMFEKQEVHTRRSQRQTRIEFDEEFVFDVTSPDADLIISVCEEFSEGKSHDVSVIGSIKIRLQSLIDRQEKATDHWYGLNPPFSIGTDISRADRKPCGAVHITVNFDVKKTEVAVENFKLLKMLGKGSFGKVLQVQKEDTNRVYAMKVLRKQDLIARNEVEHTTSECNVLRYCQHPFVVGLKYAFQTSDKLYLIMDFVGGGELFFHLKREVRFPEVRARIYAAEIVLALEHLHRHGIVYRDLKPENILLDLSGHVCLTDFGLVKEDMNFGQTTDTFCGTSEYLAPEVLRRTGHDKAVDWWSLGTLLYEMVVGIPPFYSENTREMFENILYRKLEFPPFVSAQARALCESLLQRVPTERLGGGRSDAEEIKSHPFFAELDWDEVLAKKITPDFIPTLSDPTDVSYFDEEFTSEDPYAESPRSLDELTLEEQEQFAGFSYVAFSETLSSAAAKDRAKSRFSTEVPSDASESSRRSSGPEHVLALKAPLDPIPLLPSSVDDDCALQVKPKFLRSGAGQAFGDIEEEDEEEEPELPGPGDRHGVTQVVRSNSTFPVTEGDHSPRGSNSSSEGGSGLRIVQSETRSSNVIAHAPGPSIFSGDMVHVVEVVQSPRSSDEEH